MSSTFPLPPECLQLIILHLTHLSARKSIASLLRVNKFVCAVALPLLYQDPFDDVFIFGTGNEDLDKKSRGIRKLKHLLRVLLCSLPTTTSFSTEDGRCYLDEGEVVSGLLKVAYFNEQELKEEEDFVETGWDRPETTWQDEGAETSAPLLQPLKPTLLPYYSYLTTVMFESSTHISGCLNQRRFFVRQPAVVEYLDHTGRTDRWLAEEPFHSMLRIFPATVTKNMFISQATQQRLRRDFTWAMCFMNAERIKKLCFSLSYIGRFLTLVPRLKVLSEVNFQLDRSATPLLGSVPMLAPVGDRVLRKLQEERKQHLEGMISFVQEHQRHHPRVIKTAQCCNDRTYQDPYPEEYDFRLLQLLPPLHQPQFLDGRNWNQFAANVADIDLSYVKKIDTAYSNGEIKFWDRVLNQPFLHRCHSLEKMITISLGEDVFKWAVKLRKEYGPNNEDTKSSASGLFPLRHYNVRYKEPAYGPQINDIAYAFSNTLEELYISGPFSSDLGNTLHVPKFSLGCSDNGDNEGDVPSWPILPRLRTMWAEMDYTFIRIHRRLLSQLPRLTSLNLNDRLDQYSLANVVHWEPTNFPKLRDLTLCGTPAICFHPDTLKNTPKLGKLDLSLHNIGDYSFIPDPEEFEAVEQRQDSSDGDSNVYLDDNSSSIPPLPKQPVWTWDWDLPRLTYLRLTAEFAYRFQFQMLAGTPNLVSLSLDIKSLSRGHRRTVGTSDFVKPVFKRPALARILNKGPEQQEETIRLPYWDTEAYYDDRNVQPNDGTEDEENEVSQEFEFLHVPALVSINIIGPWRFDHHALETLFSKVAPGIQYVRFPGCYGFTILEWVQSTSENLHYLQWGYTTIQFCPQMAAEAGLVRDRGPNMFGRIDYKLTERPVGRVLQNHALYHFR